MPKTKQDFYRYRGDKYPTIDFILRLHDKVLEFSEGASGVHTIGVIESAANKPVDSAGGEDAYPTFFTKVAAIGFTLAHDHGFKDANKRTALMVMLVTLAANGYYPKPKLSNREKEVVAVLAAMGYIKIEGLRIALMMWADVDPADTEA